MKTTTNFLLLVVGILLIAIPVSADLTVVVTSNTTNSIQWGWNAGTNLSSMHIDGHLMCGYDTTIPSITMDELYPHTCHTIDLVSDTGQLGNNTACTLNGTPTAYGGISNDNGINMNNVVFIVIGGVAGGLIGMILILGRARRNR